jgi:hypothetical protein
MCPLVQDPRVPEVRECYCCDRCHDGTHHPVTAEEFQMCMLCTVEYLLIYRQLRKFLTEDLGLGHKRYLAVIRCTSDGTPRAHQRLFATRFRDV